MTDRKEADLEQTMRAAEECMERYRYALRALASGETFESEEEVQAAIERYRREDSGR